MDALNQGYDCTVVCPNDTVAKVYDAIGAKTRVTRLTVFNHNTVFFYRATPLHAFLFFKMLVMTVVSFLGLLRIVRSLRPDIVHLNSSNLVLYTLLFKSFGVPTIYHVRENVVSGYFGIRRALIRATANATVRFIIFISEHEFALLGTRAAKSVVIYNYVHKEKFQQGASKIVADSGSESELRFRIIILGGLFSLKGGMTIVKSLQKTAADVELLVLGCADPRLQGEELAAVDGDDYRDEMVDLLNAPSVKHRVNFFGRVSNPEAYIAKADVLLFWAASPHFPRPVFEAWLLNKPVLYFNPLFENKIINAQNVYVIPENSEEALTQAMSSVRNSRLMSAESKADNYETARNNFTERNFIKINALYEQCLTS
ncbi:glycosyltransferase [Chryseolinea sp. Jin1]|uniref:Glycosyltransferase n=1 Tax=Chryseolinea lacunae TaxID=2801331 RepID=A0ABS1KSH6_9BACT|nr:glycosyltransferase [Chryseolinea lacunae]